MKDLRNGHANGYVVNFGEYLWEDVPVHVDDHRGDGGGIPS